MNVSDATSTNGNKNEINHVDEKNKDENLPVERNNQFNELKKRYGYYKIQNTGSN